MDFVYCTTSTCIPLVYVVTFCHLRLLAALGRVNTLWQGSFNRFWDGLLNALRHDAVLWIGGVAL